MDLIQVYYIDLPATVGGLTVRNNDGSYTVFLNAGLSVEAQRDAYKHEIFHIKNRDYDYHHDINELEHLRHGSAS